MRDALRSEPREISTLLHHDGSLFRQVGDRSGVWKMLVCQEAGEMAMVDWIKGIDRDGGTLFLAPARAFIIQFEPLGDATF